MKIKLLILAISFLTTPNIHAQKSKKEEKEQRKIENHKQTEALVNSKEFVFTGKTALPQGGRSVDLTTRSNYMKFHPGLIEGDMPYFGEVYGGTGYSRDQGIKFSGKPDKYEIKKGKKNYQIEAEVKDATETYKISLSVGFEGGAVLTVLCNNRSGISYNGDIKAPEK